MAYRSFSFDTVQLEVSEKLPQGSQLRKGSAAEKQVYGCTVAWFLFRYFPHQNPPSKIIVPLLASLLLTSRIFVPCPIQRASQTDGGPLHFSNISSPCFHLMCSQHRLNPQCRQPSKVYRRILRRIRRRNFRISFLVTPVTTTPQVFHDFTCRQMGSPGTFPTFLSRTHSFKLLYCTRLSTLKRAIYDTE